MLNQRGSALLNVLAVVAMLLIVGFGLMQAVNSDSLLAIRDADVTHAIQMAEGGIDYGLEMLLVGPMDVLGLPNWPAQGSGTPFVIGVEEGNVEVIIEEIVPDKDYVITSTSFRENATRQITAYVTRYGDIGSPFSYSLFIGGQLDPNAVLTLKNLTIHGSVHIAANKVSVEGVNFNGDVHFASQEVWVSQDSKLNMLQAKASCESYTQVYGPPNTSHWSNNMERVSNTQTLPNVDIDSFETVTGFTPHLGVTSIRFNQLDQLNYFDGDIEIIFDNSEFPTEVRMVVASAGNVTFVCADGQYQPDIDRTLIVMAQGDIIDVAKVSNKATNKPKLDLYLYSQGCIYTDQNVYMSSIMAELISVHSQNYTIQAPNPAVFEGLPEEITQAWGVYGYKITRWEN